MPHRASIVCGLFPMQPPAGARASLSQRRVRAGAPRTAPRRSRERVVAAATASWCAVPSAKPRARQTTQKEKARARARAFRVPRTAFDQLNVYLAPTVK
jgi:hypothetical protein